MIDFVEGPLVEIREKSIIVRSEIFGYEIFVSKQVIEDFKTRKPGDTSLIRLFIFVYKVEAYDRLYGFATQVEREIFTELRKTDGVGPTTAMAILSLGSAKEIAGAIRRADWRFFAEVRGMKEVKAKRIILDLAKHYSEF